MKASCSILRTCRDGIDVPLKPRLMEAFPGMPVVIEHDGNAGALAEFHFGVGKSRPNLKHLIFLTFGTGVGAEGSLSMDNSARGE